MIRSVENQEIRGGSTSLDHTRRREGSDGLLRAYHLSDPISFQSPWMRERAAILKRLCTRLESSKSERPMLGRIRSLARRWHGKPYSSRPGYRINLRWKTLHRIYTEWRQHGELAFQLRYQTRQYPVPPALQSAFVEECKRPECGSFAGAYRALKRRFKVSIRAIDSFRRALPSPVRQSLRELHRLNRQSLKLREALN